MTGRTRSVLEDLGLVDKQKAERDADDCVKATGDLMFQQFLRDNGKGARKSFMAGLRAAYVTAFASTQLTDSLLQQGQTLPGSKVGRESYRFKTEEDRQRFEDNVRVLANLCGGEIYPQRPAANSSDANHWLNSLTFGRRRAPKTEDAIHDWFQSTFKDPPQQEQMAPEASGTATPEVKSADPCVEVPVAVGPVIDEATAQNAAVTPTPLPSDSELSE